MLGEQRGIQSSRLRRELTKASGACALDGSCADSQRCRAQELACPPRAGAVRGKDAIAMTFVCQIRSRHPATD